MLKHVKLRPIAKWFDGLTSAALDPMDHRWFIYAIDKQKGLSLTIGTGHGFTLPYDHIREYMSDTSGDCDGLLLLKGQVHLKGDRLWIEPLPFSN